ncbi:MAG: DUF928 domain-containing protein [Cyanobacteria bacterium P01_F01_bin.53]
MSSQPNSTPKPFVLTLKQFSLKRLSCVSSLAILAANLVAPLPSYGLEFPDAGDRGAPARTAGGGTRGGLCEGGDWMQQSIKALVPSNNVNTFVSEQASLRVYLAEGFEDKAVEIYVQNPRTQAAVHQETIDLSSIGGSGIVQVNLPATNATGAPLLEQNQDYFWELAIICNANDRTQDYIVQGLMHRLAPSPALTEALGNNNTLAEQAALYAEAGIWQETLSIAASQQTAQPELWSALLTSVGLEDLANSYIAEPEAVEAATDYSVGMPEATPEAEATPATTSEATSGAVTDTSPLVQSP